MKKEIRKSIEQIIKYDDFDETEYASNQDKTGKSIILTTDLLINRIYANTVEK